MAKVIEKKSALVSKQKRHILANRLGYVLYPVCGVLAIELLFAEYSLVGTCLIGLLSIVGLLLIHATRNTIKTDKRGTEGEREALDILKQGLPDTYYIINNAEIYYDDRHNELDLIVIGPSGIYIVETKKWFGTISGSYSDRYLIQVNKDGTKEHYNPVKQVATHVDILQRFLKAKGVQNWIQGVVFFVHPKSTLQITNIPHNGIPLFSLPADGKDQLLTYLKRTVPRTLSQSEIEKIANII